MNNSPRLTPILVAVCVVLSAAAPRAALAQAAVRTAPGAVITPVTVAPGVGAQPMISVTKPLSGAATLGASLLPLSAQMTAPALPKLAVVAAEPLAVTAAAAPASVKIGIPDDITKLAVEAEAYYPETQTTLAPTSPAALQGKGLVERIADVIRGRAGLSFLFDSSREKSAPISGRLGFTGDLKPVRLPNGSRTDELPTVPSADRERTVLLQTYALPGSREVGGIFESSRKALAVDPANLDAVVGAVKSMVDADPARYGVPSSELRLIHVKKFEGAGEQAAAIFAYFRQTRDSLIVNGSHLSITIKVLDGKPTVVAQTGQLFPQIDVNTETVLTDEQIMGRIAARTGIPPADVSSTFEFYEEKILYSRGSWRHVKLYAAENLPFMIAVDVVTGLVFVYDNRAGLRDAAGVSGSVGGKAVDKGPIMADSVVGEIALPFLEVSIGGKSYVTGQDGRFTAGSGFEAAPEGLELTAALAGPYVRIADAGGKTLSVKVAVKPGDNRVVFNPGSTAADENALAQVNAFDKVNRSLNFLRERKLTNDRMDKRQLTVRTNIVDDCNAYYTPGRPSLNFFRSSERCVNTAYDTVAEHENGHYWDDMLGGIVDGGLSEGWGDILSMFRLDNPVIGEHFLKIPRNGVDYVRHGENAYQYNEYDEAHDQGQAWGGFAWKLRKMLIEKLGYAQGAAVAEALVLPTIFAKASTIPAAMAQVLINAMKNDGTILHEAEIRAAAKLHDVALPASPSAAGFAASLAGLFTAPLSKMSVAPAHVVPARAPFVDDHGQSPAGILAEEPAAPNARASIRFVAGALLRGRVKREIRRYMDETGLHYELHEYKSWIESGFLLIISGPEDQVREHSDNIQRWLLSLEHNR